MHLLLWYISANHFWKDWSASRCWVCFLKFSGLQVIAWFLQTPEKPQLSSICLTVFLHCDSNIPSLCNLKSNWYMTFDNLFCPVGSIFFDQNTTILLWAWSSRGVIPNSLYTIFVHVDLLSDKIYLQNLKCNFSTTSVPSCAQTSQP